MATRWVRLLLALGLAVMMVFGSSNLAKPASAAEPLPDTEACRRYVLLIDEAVIGMVIPGIVADGQCRQRSVAADQVPLRPKDQWPVPRAEQPCRQVTTEDSVEPGSPKELVDAQCVADWAEYAGYIRDHPDCKPAAEAALQQLPYNTQTRPSLVETCHGAQDKPRNPSPVGGNILHRAWNQFKAEFFSPKSAVVFVIIIAIFCGIVAWVLGVFGGKSEDMPEDKNIWRPS